ASGTNRRSGPVSGTSSVGPLSAGATVQASFPVMSYAKQNADLGGDQAVTPPDTQLAAGPTYLLETLNDSGSVWTKSGTFVTDFDLNAFFPVPLFYIFSDPRVLYDVPSGRWLMSGLAFSIFDYSSQTYVAVSQTSDPTGVWYEYVVKSNSSGVLYDQPKLGVSDDKIAIAWDDYGNGATTLLGQETWILDKAQAMAGTSTTETSLLSSPDATRFSIVPSQSLA